MQNSNRNSVETALQNKAIEATIQARIAENLSPVIKENDMLKRKIEELQNELKEKETKFGSIRQQLQMLYFLLDLPKLHEGRKVIQKGAFFSVLLNRHPQRARAQFSTIGELLSSTNKQTAKSIKRDLENVRQLFIDFGLKSKVKHIDASLRLLNEKHSFENL